MSYGEQMALVDFIMNDMNVFDTFSRLIQLSLIWHRKTTGSPWDNMTYESKELLEIARELRSCRDQDVGPSNSVCIRAKRFLDAHLAAIDLELESLEYDSRSHSIFARMDPEPLYAARLRLYKAQLQYFITLIES